jgi:putative peptidoglycan binding protein
VDDVLRAELDERLGRVGQRTLADWAGVENLEERVDGEDEIDPVVLARLREST